MTRPKHGILHEVQGGKRFYCVYIQSRPVQNGNKYVCDTVTEAAYAQLAKDLIGWVEVISNDGRPQPFSVTIEEVSRKNPEDVHTSVTITTIDRGTASPNSQSTIKTVQHRSGNAYATFLEAEQNYVAENRDHPPGRLHGYAED